jgi:hypothetical protein
MPPATSEYITPFSNKELYLLTFSPLRNTHTDKTIRPYINAIRIFYNVQLESCCISCYINFVHSLLPQPLTCYLHLPLILLCKLKATVWCLFKSSWPIQMHGTIEYPSAHVGIPSFSQMQFWKTFVSCYDYL